MEQFLIHLAELNIEIHSTYSYTGQLCREYLCEDGVPSLTAAAAEAEIEADCEELGSRNLPYVESIGIYRSIAEQLPLCGRMVSHGAAIEYGGKGYFFTAPSGTGKSTHIALWQKYLGERVRIVNGDKPILRIKENEVRVYGTPWAGKEGWQQNCSAPLAAVCLLRRGTKNEIERADAGEFLEQIFQQFYLPRDSAAMAETLELIDRLFRSVPFYVLTCDISEKAVRTSFETLTGESYPNA